MTIQEPTLCPNCKHPKDGHAEWNCGDDVCCSGCDDCNCMMTHEQIDDAIKAGRPF